MPALGLREAMVRYVRARSAVLSRSSVDGLVNDLIPFGVFLGDHHPRIHASTNSNAITSRSSSCEPHPRLARKGRPGSPGLGVGGARHGAHRQELPRRHHAVGMGRPACPPACVRVRCAPSPRPLPRALAPDIDAALMHAIAALEDPFACSALLVLRRAGLRLGECLDLPLDCVVDYGPTGTWLRVPLGKLGTERSVPLDADTVAALDAWAAQRGQQRPHADPRTGAPTDFLFAEHGRRLKAWRIRKGLRVAVVAAGLTGPGGEPLTVTPHQLRHTFATELANAGMSLQALMALLGHVTPEMTLRYATLASPTLRAAYDEAIGKIARRIPVAPAGHPAVPAKVDWIASEFLKTRLGTGYCSRHLAAEACPYANVCETCDNFVPGHEFAPALRAQLTDIYKIKTDADERGWTDEAARHQRVIEALDGHLWRLDNPAPKEVPLDLGPLAG